MKSEKPANSISMIERRDLDKKESLAEKLEVPRMFQVVFCNDHYTPFDFVELCLTRIFDKNLVEAQKLAREVHNNGRAVVGTYTHEIAETKMLQTTDLAREHQYPLIVTLQKQ